MLHAADADDLGAPGSGRQGGINGGGVDAVGIDDPQQIAFSDVVVLYHDLAVTGQPLHLHGLHGAGAEHGLLIDHGADVQQTACPEEDLHGCQIGMAAGAEHIDQLVLLDLIGYDPGALENIIPFCASDFVDNCQNLVIIQVHDHAFLHK